MKKKLLFLKYVLSISFALLLIFHLDDPVKAESVEQEIKGVHYDGQIRQIDSKKELNAVLNIKEINFENGEFSIVANATYKNTHLAIKSSGKVYDSVTAFFNKSSNSKTILLDSQSRDYEILSLTEEQVFKELSGAFNVYEE